MPDVLFLVVRRDFVDQILKGDKTADLRVDSVDPNTRYVVMYDPEAKGVVGGFTVERIVRKNKALLWRHVDGKGIPKSRYDNYFRARREGTAILIQSAERFDPPISLRDIRSEDPDFFVPVSFASLPDNHPLTRVAASRSVMLRSILSDHTQSSLAHYLRADYRLRGIRADELPNFRMLVQDVVGGAYDDIDKSFTDIIEKANEKGTDELGYFTLTKRIWVAADNDTDAAIGYVVTTEKRGGSVKYGPTILKPDFQGKGIAARMRQQLDEQYSRRGFRKGYSTIPADHVRALRYLLKAGYNVEAHLVRHYRSTRDEFVLGKVYTRARPASRVDAVLPEVAKPRIERQVPSYQELHEILQERAAPFYDGLDEDFTRSILAAHERYRSRQPWETKSKQVFAARDAKGGLQAVLIGTPKRGGSVKLTPIASRAGPRTLAEVILSAEDFFFAEGNRKVYSLTPVLDTILTAALVARRYSPEGILREPYRAGIDMIVYSRFRGEPHG